MSGSRPGIRKSAGPAVSWEGRILGAAPRFSLFRPEFPGILKKTRCTRGGGRVNKTELLDRCARNGEERTLLARVLDKLERMSR